MTQIEITARLSSPYAWVNRKELAVLLGFQTDKSSAFDDLLSQPGFPPPMSLTERTKRWNVKEVSDFMKALRARNRGGWAASEREYLAREIYFSNREVRRHGKDGK